MTTNAPRNLASKQVAREFPPRRDYASLAIKDLLDAREAYHVYLSSLDNVVATAIGRYRIHQDDWFAEHASDQPRPPDFPRVKEAKTLGNSVVRPWSWPAVLVFVRQWDTPDQLKNQIVPSALYLSDGRVVPTCVIEAKPDEEPPPPVPGPSQVSDLLGGGYSCIREHQGITSFGTIACLVYQDGTYYALTNRHVAGDGQGVIGAYTRGGYHRVGICADSGITRVLFPKVFPAWPGDKTYLTLDAGLIRIDDFEDWTSQVYGIGEVGTAFDATEHTVSLDLIGCPLRAFGGTSGVIEGEIQALFYRFDSQGGYDYATDLLIGPRSGFQRDSTSAPFTRPGDSGTMWFYDPPFRDSKAADLKERESFEPGRHARRLRPVAMQWGGQRFKEKDQQSAFALASFISSICYALDVGIVRDWSTGHDEYWGKIGHFAIGWKACDIVSGPLHTLMSKNQARIGFGDDKLGEGSQFTMGAGAFVPLADVPDYVWVHSSSRPSEPIQHFADIDIYDIDGGPSLIEKCYGDASNVAASVWKQYFDGFAGSGVGPEEGTLPFRVWQIWDAMVDYLNQKDLEHFVAAAGVLSHYVGDASQPLHCSYLHHGVPPMTSANGRPYPFPRSSDEFTAYKDTREYKIHGIYEETMLEVDPAGALAAVNNVISQGHNPVVVTSGHEAATETVRLMYRSQQRLAPMTIIDADDPSGGPKTRAEALWNNDAIKDATVQSLAESVFLLADLWISAWQKADTSWVSPADLKAFTEASLKNIYRSEPDFVPSLSLNDMASSGKFEP